MIASRKNVACQNSKIQFLFYFTYLREIQTETYLPFCETGDKYYYKKYILEHLDVIDQRACHPGADRITKAVIVTHEKYIK